MVVMFVLMAAKLLVADAIGRFSFVAVEKICPAS